MKPHRRTNLHGPCLLGTSLTGPVALVALQEGAKTLAGLFGLAFIVLFILGAYKVRVYYR